MRVNAFLFAIVASSAALAAQEPATRIHAATVIDGTGKVLDRKSVV